MQSGFHNSISSLNLSSDRLSEQINSFDYVSVVSLAVTCNIIGQSYLISYHAQLEYTLLGPDIGAVNGSRRQPHRC